MEGTKIKMSELLSDGLNIKLRIIEQLLRKSANGDYLLESVKLIPLDVIENIRDLNQARNGFSHQTAKSEDQAASLFAEYFDEVFGILESLEGLEDVTLMKFINTGTDALCPRFEVFKGHSMSTTIKGIKLTPEEHASCILFLNTGSLLLKIASKIYSLKPFMHFVPDASGSYNKLCFYKKKEGESPKSTIYL
jgi:hypothetical protein